MKTARHSSVQFAVIGDPISHSLSPLIHNTALSARGIQMTYGALRIPTADLASVTSEMRAGSIKGINVTRPHKESIIPLLDELTTVASDLRAVNTVCVERTETIRLIGDNTDVYGFAKPLQQRKEDLAGARCVVWGAGGAARAVVYALYHEFSVGVINIVARQAEKADRLIADLSLSADRVRSIAWADVSNVMPTEREAKLLVNTTPLGMDYAPDMLPCADLGSLHSGQIVYDLVYKPLKTPLMIAAQERGAEVIGGLEMLIGQASQSFRLWTGTDMPLDGVRGALADHLRNTR
jgi:shikimate dehydrogenase